VADPMLGKLMADVISQFPGFVAGFVTGVLSKFFGDWLTDKRRTRAERAGKQRIPAFSTAARARRIAGS
jgi:hypothetical protein